MQNKTVTYDRTGYKTRCHYSGRRHGCQHIAVVRYGNIALCESCDAKRSTVGRGEKGVRITY